MAYFRSLLWLIGCGGIGYALMEIIKPDEQIVSKKFSGHTTNAKYEIQSKNQQFLNVLKEASESQQPIYRQSKEELIALRDKALKK